MEGIRKNGISGVSGQTTRETPLLILHWMTRLLGLVKRLECRYVKTGHDVKTTFLYVLRPFNLGGKLSF